MINVGALLEITKWRVREFLREPEALFWVFAFPIILAVVLGVAFKDRGPAPVSIVVEEGTGAAELVAAFERAPRLTAHTEPPDAARQSLRTGNTPLVVVPGNPVTFRFDSTRGETLVARLLAEAALQEAAGRIDVAEIREYHTAEQGARYIDFLIPGLLGMNIMGTGIWGVGFGIVQARNRKLLKRFVASPMPRSHFLMGHILARLVFLVFEVGAVLGFGYLVFDMPFRGSPISVAFIAIVGSMSFAGLGLLIASRVRTLEGASGLMNLVMMPMWVMSGIFFAYSRFPEAMQPVIKSLPLTALNDSLRGVVLDGQSLVDTLPAIGVMSFWMLASFALALKIFKWT